jgi:hypothetical protein
MSTDHSQPDPQYSDAQPLADKSTPVAMLLAVVLSPVAYYYVGRTKLAVINLLTLNYLMLGIVITPIHVYTILNGTEEN